jgi:hypothetical protein
MLHLEKLINEAKAFGSAACSHGKHTWVVKDGRPCPYDYNWCCSQTVYICFSCGETDYGDTGGPGDIHYSRLCPEETFCMGFSLLA